MSNTLNYNGNGYDGGSAPTSQTGTVSVVVQGPGTLSKSGNVFVAWNKAADGSGVSYLPGSTFIFSQSTETLYAQWTTTYALTYSGNGNTSGTTPAFQTGLQYVLVANSGTLAKTGYVFSYWNTAADNSGTIYLPGTLYAFGTAPSTATLYAQYTQITTLYLTYNGNDNTGGTVPATQSATTGNSITISGNTGGLTRIGSCFLGWNTDPYGEGTFYLPGQIVTLHANMTLYAVWGCSASITTTRNLLGRQVPTGW